MIVERDNLDSILELLRKELQKTLPGFEAHRKMIPVSRLKMPFEAPENAKNGAVLILLYKELGQLTLCLIKRSNDGGVHSGQISFPGGRKEDTDKDLIQTALRETEEEIGVPSNQVDLIGNLSPLYIPVSNYKVMPVVGFYNQRPKFIINKTEVAKVLEVPIRYLLNPNNNKLDKVSVRGKSIEAPVYEIGKHKIWGATAMILSEFIEVLNQLDRKDL